MENTVMLKTPFHWKILNTYHTHNNTKKLPFRVSGRWIFEADHQNGGLRTDGEPRKDGGLRRHGGLRKDGGLRRAGGFSKRTVDFVPVRWTSKGCGSAEVQWSGGEENCWYGSRNTVCEVSAVSLFSSFFNFTGWLLIYGNP